MALSLSKTSEKLLITAFKDAKRTSRAGKVDQFEAMFNPDKVSLSFQNVYREPQGLNSSGAQGSYVYTKEHRIQLSFLIDGSTLGAAMGSKSIALSPTIKPVDVAKKVDEFRTVAFQMNGNIHQPNFLKLSMGSALKEVDCRLQSFELEYSNFNDEGNPLRALIKATFIAESPSFKRNAKAAKKSADLTHHRTIKNGDTLPLLAKSIYGDASAYIELARINNLDHFRKLSPGTQLIFPPKTQ